MSLKAKDPATELSKRMLSGWTLLGDTCTIGCNVPLVENKRQKVIECVSCGSHFNRNGDKMVPISSTPNENKEAGNPATPSPSTSTSTPATAPTQTKVPEKEREDEFMEDEEDEEDDDLLPHLTPEELAKLEERRKRNDRTSKILGEKLLAGWTMLSDTCPNPDCYQPLMRDTQKQMWCLGCNTMVVRQEDFDPSKHKLVGKKEEKDEKEGKVGKVVEDGKKEEKKGAEGNPGIINPSSSFSFPTSPVAPQPLSTLPLPLPLPPSSSHAHSEARQRLYDRFSTGPSSSSSSPSFAPASSTSAPSLNFHTAHSHQINPDTSHPPSSVPHALHSSSSNPQHPSSVAYAIAVLNTKVHDLGVMLAQATHPEDIRVISSALKECGLAISALQFRI